MKEEYLCRQATTADIPTLVSRRRMFEEIASSRGVVCSKSRLDAFEQRYADYLQTHMKLGTVAAWVVEDTDTIVAGGTVSFLPWPPGLGEGPAALFHSLFTAPECRRRAIARRITETAIRFCKDAGSDWMLLGASDVGRPLYESLGFTPASTMMRLPLRWQTRIVTSCLRPLSPLRLKSRPRLPTPPITQTAKPCIA